MRYAAQNSGFPAHILQVIYRAEFSVFHKEPKSDATPSIDSLFPATSRRRLISLRFLLPPRRHCFVYTFFRRRHATRPLHFFAYRATHAFERFRLHFRSNIVYFVVAAFQPQRAGQAGTDFRHQVSRSSRHTPSDAEAACRHADVYELFTSQMASSAHRRERQIAHRAAADRKSERRRRQACDGLHTG